MWLRFTDKNKLLVKDNTNIMLSHLTKDHEKNPAVTNNYAIQ